MAIAAHTPARTVSASSLWLELVQCLVGGEREEHALERADEQLEAADDHPRVAEREHERVELGPLGGKHETTPRGTLGLDA